jgi:cysteine desulfurase/selenocysteine lyase
VVGRSEFPANVFVWENLRAKGVEVTVLPPGPGYTTPEDIRQALDGRTRVVALSFVQFHNGYRADVEEIGSICRERGIIFAVDGIQGAGVLELDVSSSNIDIFASGGQKWLLSPFGTGFLYCSKEVSQKLFPVFPGWLSVREMDRTGRSVLDMPFELVEDARRFEIGTLSYQDMAGFRESLKLLLSVGVAEIQKHIFALLDALIPELTKLPVQIQSVLSPRNRSGILAFKCSDVRKLKHYLDQDGIVVAEREGAIRVSPHLYNNFEDIERLCRSLRTHLHKLG